MNPLMMKMMNHQNLSSNADWRTWDSAKRFDFEVADYPFSLPAPSYAWLSMTLPTTPEMQKRAMARIAERFKGIPTLPAPEARTGKPRLGYIGSKLDADHVSGLLFTHLFPHHDPAQVDVFVFLSRTHEANHNRERLFKTRGITVVPLGYVEDDEEAATIIRGYGIDLLISTDGWNDDPRPGIVARRPARKQAWWQGTATTSGAPWVDYLIIDKYIDGQERGWRTEQAFHMPDTYYVAGHVHNPAIPEVPTRESLEIPKEAFVFSNLNNHRKLNPDIWYDWIQILKQCPNSVLLLLEVNAGASANLRRTAKAWGVNPDRLIFVPITDPWQHIARAGVADLMLDTYYYGAHTTLAESLWMDVPAISLIGNTMSGRVGYSMLNSVDLGGLAVADRSAYIFMATLMYNERGVLRIYKDRLKEAKHSSALFNMRAQAASIEQFVQSL